jgi:hypothetical protein
MVFSQRLGIIPEKVFQIGEMDGKLRNRLFNALNKLIPFNNLYAKTNVILDDLVDYCLDKLGIILAQSGKRDLLKMRILNGDWFEVYDILEYIFEYLTIQKEKSNNASEIKSYQTLSILFCEEVQRVLQEEKAGYQLLNNRFVPITNIEELTAVEESQSTQLITVNNHMKKATSLFADRTNPDYENSIKESISAVESLCCYITGLKGKQATLGLALKKLKENGVEIHGALESAFSNLYGYASDESGIRHGSIDFRKVAAEDAKFMLIACSAFINYLIEKTAKPQGGLSK